MTREETSPYIKIVRSMLEGLAKTRMEKGAWEDSESEAADRETQSFKLGESLRPFYVAAADPQFPAESSPLPESLLSQGYFAIPEEAY
jgi:hypothetical protein